MNTGERERERGRLNEGVRVRRFGFSHGKEEEESAQHRPKAKQSGHAAQRSMKEREREDGPPSIGAASK